VQKLRSIQVLRGIAALGVVIYHASGSRFGVGAAGVDLFFVISGFIMATISPGLAAGPFIRDRLWRILPLYFVCSAAYVALISIQPTTCRTLASLTLWPAWPNWCFPYIIQAWTLGFELFFYALVAMFIRRQNWLWVVLPAFILWRLVLPTPGFTWLGNTIILEFLAGMLLTKLPRKYGGVALATGFCYLFLAPVETKSLLRPLYWGVPAFLIVHGALTLEQRFKSNAWNLPLAIGDSSYSLYLVHIMVLKLVGLGFFVDVPLAVGIGYAVHRLVERPLLRLKNFHWDARSRRPATMLNHDAADSALATVPDAVPILVRRKGWLSGPSRT
jgi:exopolysaccharide production protein ExoZ